MEQAKGGSMEILVETFPWVESWVGFFHKGILKALRILIFS